MPEHCNYRKIKLLKLQELLRQKTDDQHPLSTNQLCNELAKLGIPCDRRTLSQDIDVLNGLGYEVISRMSGHEKVYYIEDRNFSIPELRILIDAVQNATFITEKKSEELIQKIAALGGTHQDEVLTRNMVYLKKRKHRRESIYYNISELEEAITSQHKVIFRYYDIGLNGSKQYQCEGRHYVVEPVQLLLDEDSYNLLCYMSGHRKASVYRIDRMESVQIIEDKCTEKSLSMENEIGQYTAHSLKMLGGPLVYVTLEFSKTLISSVYDKFGEDIIIRSVGNDRYTARIQVQKNPSFWGWLFQFAGDMKIMKPKSLSSEYLERARLVLSKNEETEDKRNG